MVQARREDSCRCARTNGENQEIGAAMIIEAKLLL